MGDSYHQSSSRLGLRSGGGEIVEVQGGHIVRSTGRKDRHSKVCTAKGPRDRRVRLSAHTAIQFYDVQDRLGYDRPSKAVDWLIKKAKAAIDELAELPAWKPTTGSTANAAFEPQKQHENCQENSHHNQHQQQISIHHADVLDSIAGSSSKRPLAMVGNESEIQGFHHGGGNDNHPSGNSSSFLPPSMDSDSIADTIKSFFPMGASAEANTSAMQFQTFPPPDLLSRTSSHNQDLRLSLQSFQDPLLLHHHHHHSQQAHHHNTNNHTPQQQVQAQAAFFTGTTPVQLGFDGSGWSEQHQQQIQRLSSWNAVGDTGGSSSGGASGAAGGGYVYNSVAGPSLLQPFFGQNQFFSSSQRGPLQSSNTPSVRAWIDPSTMAMNNNTADHSQHQHHQAMIFNYQQSISGINFASGVGGFSGFRVPSRIQGDEEEHDGISDKPSSASSDSRH